MSNIVNYFNNQINNLKKSSPKQILYSFAIAFICWVVISITKYPTTPQTISNVPIQVDISGTSAEANDLSVISQDIEKVKVRITGKRTKIGNLKSEDLVAKAVVENITQAGTYELSMIVESLDGTEFNTESIEPSTVTIKFDKYVTKEIPIVVSAPNIKAKDGYIMDENSPQATPSTISITGPQTQVDSIAKFVITLENSKELDNYYTYHSTKEEEWSMYNENGSEIDITGLTFDLKDIQVDFKAYMTKTLPLTYKIINAPSDNFEPNFSMSADEIVVASSDNDLENREEISLGVIDMNDVDLNYSKEFNIELPASYRNISGITSVTISLNSNDYAKREFSNLTNFILVNAPSNYDIEVVTSSLNVELIAPSYLMDMINQNDFVLEVDLSSTQITGSLFNAYVNVQLQNYPNTWCVGRYIITLRATEKTIETTSSLESSKVVTNSTTSTTITTSN